MDFICGFIVGFILSYLVTKAIFAYKEKKDTQKKEVDEIYKRFEAAPRFFNIKTKELFSRVALNLLGYSYSLEDELITDAYCIYVDIYNIDPVKKHIYLKIKAETYKIDVSEVMENSNIASGYDRRVYGAISFKHDFDNLKPDSKVEVRFFETKENVFEARAVSCES